jgi:signal transduction histidine kinase
MAIHLCLEELAGPLTPKQAELLHAAREDCERLQTIVDDLLDLARLQAGRLELRRSVVPAGELIDRAIDEHRKAALEREVRLEGTVDPLAGEVVADPERIAIVLSNLITNAIRHSLERGVVRVRAVPENECVRFEVEDAGPGIAPEHRAEVFEKFFQAPGGMAGSAGIGLSISREIVEAHAGSIGVDSEVGKGSRFWFRLPAARGG